MINLSSRLVNLIFLTKLKLIDLLRLTFSRSTCISIVRKVQRPPYGGGNQFCLALHAACNRNQFTAVFNFFSKKIDIYLVDGNYISTDQLYKLIKIKESGSARIIHRIDGPTLFYKGDLNPDQASYEINHKIATETIFQSLYTKLSYEKIGFNFKNPRIVLNGFDERYFFKAPKNQNDTRIKLIATSWSDNKKKGLYYLEYLDKTIDSSKYQITFIGRIQSSFKHITTHQPIASEALGKVLGKADIYLALSENDPCSNALCDALGCNLPVVYLNSGGHPELVGPKGLGFSGTDDLWKSIDLVASNLEHYRNQSSNTSGMMEVINSYFPIVDNL